MVENPSYREYTAEEPDERLRVTSRCILAQDQALFWVDMEPQHLREGWDKCLREVVTLEKDKQGLEQENQNLELRLAELELELEDTNRHNSQLVDAVLATDHARSRRDALVIATLEARIAQAEEALRVTMRTAHRDQIWRQEKEDLAESLGEALTDKEIWIGDLERRSELNYYHLVYLGGQYYMA